MFLSVHEWQQATALKEFIHFTEYNVLTQTKTRIFIAERVTLHLEQEIPNEIDPHPFQVWVLTFFHPPSLSKPWLVVLVVKTHNLVVVAVFLLSVLLITYFEILLPSPQPLSFLDVCHWHQYVCQTSSACTAGRIKRPSSFSVLFLEASSQKPLLPSFLHLLLMFFPESILKPSRAQGVQCPLCSPLCDWPLLWWSGPPLKVCPLSIRNTQHKEEHTDWAQAPLNERRTSLSPCR